MREVQLSWSRLTLESTSLGLLLDYIEQAQFLGYAERNDNFIDILVRVIFKEGFTPNDLNFEGTAMELVEVLTAPQSSWLEEWVLQVRFIATESDLVALHTSARSASITPETILDETGVTYMIRGPPQPVAMVVKALRMILKPDRLSASSLEPTSILKNSIASQQQLRVVMAAWKAGWYSIPRRMTLADLAREIGLSRSTVSEHLNRVETELTRLLIEAIGDPSEIGKSVDENYSVDFFWKNIHPDDYSLVRKMTTDAITNMDAIKIIFRVRTLNSAEYRLIRTIGTPIFDGDGNYISMEGTVEDLSSHRDAHEVMKLSVKIANLRSKLGDYLKYGSWNWNLENMTVDWSDNMFELHGCDPKEFNPDGDGFMSVIHPDFRKIVEEVEMEAIESLEPFEYDYHIIRPNDGEIRVMRATGSVVTDRNGKATQLMGIANDVTELSSSEKFFQNTLKSDNKSILEAIGNFEINVANRLIHLSPEARAILGG